ncbi:MAG: hypothetical protein GY787_15555 [Alteromonadales bacterium]|nr:hypothetical protein [Alteromonadales bacterium]MCP4987482.1 hypothetical protein [Colwellia sp.]
MGENTVEFLENSNNSQRIRVKYATTGLIESTYDVIANEIIPIKSRVLFSMGYIFIYFIVFVVSFILTPVIFWLYPKLSKCQQALNPLSAALYEIDISMVNNFKGNIVIKFFGVILLLNLSACSVFLGKPSERVTGFDDFKLCTKLADYTFKYNAEWSWALTDEIKKRKLDRSERCNSTYTNRTNRIMRKTKAIPVSFSDAVNDPIKS